MSIVPDEVRRHQLTVEAYHKMGEAGLFAENLRVELIDGEIFDMAPVGPPHGSIVDRLNERFVLAVAKKAIVRVQNPIRLGDLSEPEPDLCLLRRVDDFYAASTPQAQDVYLVVEVADTSLRHDRDVKAALYSRHGIPEFWLIDLPNRQVQISREPTADGYLDVATLSDPDHVAVNALEGLQLDLSGLL